MQRPTAAETVAIGESAKALKANAKVIWTKSLAGGESSLAVGSGAQAKRRFISRNW